MNIIGEGIQDFVSNQIKTRQIVYGSGGVKNRTLEQIEYLNAKTAFVKLVSSVDLEARFNPTSKELQAIKKVYGSNELAKEFILFNGTTDVNNQQRSGINRTGNLINHNAAYGIGGLEFGLRPMPGITSVDIKTETRGTLKTATVNIKAWNRVQFEIVDLLYLRLGYSVLLEWGNTIYFDNAGVLQKNQINSIAADFLNGTLDVNTTLTKIQEKREQSKGNYDALYGRVVNFSWDFAEDGSYNINLIIRSIGDVIESLKMNILVDDKTNINTQSQNSSNNAGGNNQTEPPTIESYADKNQIGFLLYNVKRVFERPKTPEKNNGSVSITSIINLNTNENLLFSPDIEQKKNFLKQTFEGKNEPEYYIRLGALLAYIQNKIFQKYDGKIPILNINYQEDNYVYTVYNQISMDPRVCLIKTKIKTTLDNTYYYAPEGEDYVKEIGGYKVGQIMNVYVNFMYVLETIDSNTDNKGTCTLISFLKALLAGINTSIGGVNNLDIHVENDIDILIIDQNPLPGKNDILTSLNKTPSNNDDIATINLYGYYNNKTTAGFVRNFGLKTEITPDLASMLTIGAQAAGSVVGEDSTALSKLNEGLKDRIAPTKTDSSGANTVNPTTQEQLADLNERFPNAKKNFDLAIFELGSKNNNEKPIWNGGSIDSYTQLQLDFVTYQTAKKAITEKKASNHIGFIPVSLNLTLDGISGFKIYNALRVDTTYLPSNYPVTMDFLITGITNKIENNVWTTDLTTVMVPKDPSQSDDSLNPKQTTGTTNQGNNVRASNRNRNCAAEDQQLSPNYTLSRLSCSAPAAQFFIPLEGVPKTARGRTFTRQQIIENLRALAINILEPIRAAFPTTINVTNAYRDKGDSSQHEIGEAVDIQFFDIAGTIENQNIQMLKRAQDIQKILARKNGYDQFLLEYKTDNGGRPWIHISYRKDGKNRREVKTFLNNVTAQNGNGTLYNPLA